LRRSCGGRIVKMALVIDFACDINIAEQLEIVAINNALVRKLQVGRKSRPLNQICQRTLSVNTVSGNWGVSCP
jgi:hypothetical protein